MRFWADHPEDAERVAKEGGNFNEAFINHPNAQKAIRQIEIIQQRKEMKTFTHGQKIKIASEEHSLNGKIGTVTRCRFSDNGAWVKMDDPLPDNLASFPKGDSRRDHILLFPDECERSS